MQQNHRTIWNKCLSLIRKEIPEQSYKTWFEPIVPVRVNGSTLNIQVPTKFFFEWLEENYVHILKAAIVQVLGSDAKLEYSVKVPSAGRSDKLNPGMRNAVAKASVRPTLFPKPNTSIPQGKHQEQNRFRKPKPKPENPNLSDRYRFENFIEGDCNRLARSAGYAIAQNPGVTSFNPFMIYGNSGLGKTHLVQAIGNEIKDLSGKSVLYISAEGFVNEFVKAIKSGKGSEFTEQYLHLDVFILDDIQFLSGKEKSQESFFHIFNHLHQSRKQIILTSDQPPRDLKGLQDRLLSRFKWGLTADLDVPDFETRKEIIRCKAHDENVRLSPKVIDFLAHQIDSNVREIEGVLISLFAKQSLINSEIDIQLARVALGCIVKKESYEVNLDTILRTTSSYFGLEISDLKSKSRKKELVIARHIAMYLAANHTNLPLKVIGWEFGKRDHSTVIHANKKIKKYLEEKNEEVTTALKGIRDAFERR